MALINPKTFKSGKSLNLINNKSNLKLNKFKCKDSYLVQQCLSIVGTLNKLLALTMHKEDSELLNNIRSQFKMIACRRSSKPMLEQSCCKCDEFRKNLEEIKSLILSSKLEEKEAVKLVGKVQESSVVAKIVDPRSYCKSERCEEILSWTDKVETVEQKFEVNEEKENFVDLERRDEPGLIQEETNQQLEELNSLIEKEDSYFDSVSNEIKCDSSEGCLDEEEIKFLSVEVEQEQRIIEDCKVGLIQEETKDPLEFYFEEENRFSSNIDFPFEEYGDEESEENGSSVVNIWEQFALDCKENQNSTLVEQENKEKEKEEEEDIYLKYRLKYGLPDVVEILQPEEKKPEEITACGRKLLDKLRAPAGAMLRDTRKTVDLSELSCIEDPKLRASKFAEIQAKIIEDKRLLEEQRRKEEEERIIHEKNNSSKFSWKDIFKIRTGEEVVIKVQPYVDEIELSSVLSPDYCIESEVINRGVNNNCIDYYLTLHK